ncbi:MULTISPECIES: hypothetical protein [Microbaculum]|uniref:Cupin domain-containing protein n=1 Tax=Microbaculum marinisediminis TaxID=2931392 RepID=A0AAW5R6B2_9HYPH|nr:hypothetical protein [Microbaculum sp. A6E488]MCT8974453.1 hypothetical protein [Microbaculum sp. A6E488]
MNEQAMAAYRKIDFDDVAWSEVLPGLRVKAVQEGPRTIRLVEFQGGFVEPGWCEKGHVGFVVSGRLTVEFDSGVEVFEPGQGLFFTPGTGGRHKVRQPDGETAHVFLTEPI